MAGFDHDLTQIEALIFDLDGTMVHTLGDFQVALHRTMADLDLPAVSNEMIEQTIGKGSEHLIRTLLAYQIARPEFNDDERQFLLRILVIIEDHARKME